MHLYVSGTPSNDVFTVLENQHCSHRLVSMHEDYAEPVLAWLRNIKAGVRTVDDMLTSDFLRHLDHADATIRTRLAELGAREAWPGYASVLSAASRAAPATYPKHVMLDSGAFTAWNAKRPVELDQVRRDYSRFLEQAGDLFDEVWLINLDDIPGSPDRSATAAETAESIRKSDENLAVLQAEFGDRVLPVFHQHEGKARLLEVIDQASGYLCLSPTNGLPEEERWRWAQLARSALDELRCDVRTHGLATTGNQMIREAQLYSGDSAAWRRHGGFGLVDLVRHEATVAENVELARGSQEWLGSGPIDLVLAA